LNPEDYEALLTAAGKVALVSVTNAAGDIIYVNDTFVNISKYTRDELIGQNHRILKSGQQSAELFVDLWKTISAGGLWRGEIKNRAKDGSYYWVDTSIAPILDEAGKPERYIAVRFLVTDRKGAEEDLNKQTKAILNVLEDSQGEKEKFQKQVTETQKFALATDASGEHVVITDPEGIILYANPAATVTTGYTREEMVGTKAGILWGRQMESSFYRKMWGTIKVDKKVFQGEFNNIRKNGVAYIAAATISPVLDANGNVLFFIGTERDVTKERDIDRVKTEFVSLASHQLRTPLSSINWYTEMLLAEDAGAINAEQKKYLDEIYAGSQRMVALVNALLNVSRLELGTFVVEPSPVEVVAMMRSVLEEQQPQIVERKQKVETVFSPDIPVISADQNLLRMVFQNLLSNAVKYTPEGGSIRVSIATEGDHIAVVVADTGMGIPQQEQEKIFGKLFRATNVREAGTDGTGLGLYIVKSIVEHSGGSVRFESAVNKGTTFYVTLPLSGMKKKEGTKSLGE
jgi:PAS domain S-box-containing protein